METGKPSKEQLDYYFKTSRKYFDSLAVKYLQEDKSYYDNYIAPYYNSPFKVQRPAQMKIFIFAMAIIMFMVGVLVFSMLYSKGYGFKDIFTFKDEPDETETMYETETTTEKKVITNNNPDGKFDTLAVSYLKSDFEKGAYYYGRKNYNMAEQYLNKIDKKDKDYVPAREVLKMIQNEKSTRDSRKKSIEKIN